MNPKDFLVRRPVFTVEEFAEFLSTDRPRTADTRQSLLTHHLRSGNILRVKQGLYATVPPGMNPESSPVDMFLLAWKMSKDAVLAYHTALDFYGDPATTNQRMEIMPAISGLPYLEHPSEVKIYSDSQSR